MTGNTHKTMNEFLKIKQKQQQKTTKNKTNTKTLRPGENGIINSKYLNKKKKEFYPQKSCPSEMKR